MRHNLFSHPTEVTVKFDGNGDYTLESIIEAQNLIDVLDDLDYDTGKIDKALKTLIDESNLINESEKQELLGKLYLYMSENSYLKTILAENFDRGTVE